MTNHQFPHGEEAAANERPITEGEIDKLHSEAFRNLEGRISDCVWMSVIALELIADTIEGTEEKHEKAMFAVCKTATKLKQLKADYQAVWYGEKKLSD